MNKSIIFHSSFITTYFSCFKSKFLITIHFNLLSVLYLVGWMLNWIWNSSHTNRVWWFAYVKNLSLPICQLLCINFLYCVLQGQVHWLSGWLQSILWLSPRRGRINRGTFSVFLYSKNYSRVNFELEEEITMRFLLNFNWFRFTFEILTPKIIICFLIHPVWFRRLHNGTLHSIGNHNDWQAGNEYCARNDSAPYL